MSSEYNLKGISSIIFFLTINRGLFFVFCVGLTQVFFFYLTNIYEMQTMHSVFKEIISR